jgi:hypothetical protein
MSTELERRLEGLLGELPEPEPGVGERAQAAAMAALRPTGPPRRGLRTAVVVFATAVVLLAIAAGSLAAAGALHVSFGPKAKQRPAVSQLTLPPGASGAAVVVDGRLSVVTKGGFRLQGLPVTAAALSPHALYVAAGIGSSLVAMRPDGTRAWSHPTGGTVVAIAWAPFGNRIAYVVRTAHRLVLHVIWGNGENDTVIDRAVRAVRPSWRADSLAFAYVGAGGHAIVYDVAHQRRQQLAVKAPVTSLAFAPRGDSVAVERTGGVWLLHQSAASEVRGDIEAFGWQRDRLAVALSSHGSATIELFAADGSSRGSSRVRGTVVAVTPKLVVVRQGRSLVAGGTTLLTVPRGASVRGVQVG